jgi:hypothetical protein
MNRRKKIGVIREFNVNISVAFCLLAIAIIIYILFVTFMPYREELKFLTTLIGGVTILYTAYYAAMTLRINIARDKQRVSVEICQRFTNISMTELRLFIENEIKQIAHLELYNRIRSDIDLLAKVSVILGFFEDMSISIQEEYADELILKKSLNFTSCWIFENLNQYIIDVRKRMNRETLYIEYEKLFNAWKHDKSLLTGKELSIK